MAINRTYFGIENLNLTAPQKQTLINGLLTIGANESSNQPCERMHTRTRNDNDAVIFEALVNEDNLTLLAIRTRLANIFSVAVGTITTSTNQVANIGLVVTFIHGGQNKIRMMAFGHNGSAWGTTAQSRSAAQAYLAANAVDWGDA
jgi:hypothetical protein